MESYIIFIIFNNLQAPVASGVRWSSWSGRSSHSTGLQTAVEYSILLIWRKVAVSVARYSTCHPGLHAAMKVCSSVLASSVIFSYPSPTFLTIPALSQALKKLAVAESPFP